MSDKKNTYRLKIAQQMNITYPIIEMSRYKDSIWGCMQSSILQIDMKHDVVYTNKIEGKCRKFKYLTNCMDVNSGYYIITPDRISKFQGGIISQSNSLAQFWKEIDANLDNLVFTKYHKNHKKYSINILNSNKKQVLKLQPNPFSQIHIKRNQPQIYYSNNGKVAKFSVLEPQNQTNISKNAQLLYDSFNVYIVSGTKNHKQVNIYQSRTNKIQTSWKCNYEPFKIQNFNNIILVGYNDGLQIYDRRKLVQAYVSQKLIGFSDFYYEPNFNKIFASTKTNLISFQL